ncbi:MAG: DedA family protein [Patescibacteria group bacterium]|jgi:membrane protein DedA with SNARE-associated domain
MGITDAIVHLATDIIQRAGYAGIGFLMALESMIFPVPSEAVMPFAGFAWADGTLRWFGIFLASTIGSLVGSWISYAIGRYGGRPFIRKFGKYFLLNEQHLDQTEAFFQRWGEKAIFVCRFIPVVRHFISIPAGAGKMHLGKFTLYTLFGAAIWNMFLTYLGFRLGSDWEKIQKYSHVLDIVVIAVIILGIVYLVYRKMRKGRNVTSLTKSDG